MAWKYITQDIIDAGGISVTSAEMFAEAREYNIKAVRNYNKKRRNHWLIALWKFLGIPALNLLVGWLHQKTENELKNKSGYPAFSRLAVTTSQSDSDSISNITFDSIREKARREQNRD